MSLLYDVQQLRCDRVFVVANDVTATVHKPDVHEAIVREPAQTLVLHAFLRRSLCPGSQTISVP